MSGVFQPNVFQRNVFQEAPAFYGGIGHFLEEMQRARDLAKITRQTPAPIDRTTPPQFAPIGSPPAAPIAPAIDLAAIQQQRMAAQQAAAAARAKRQRSDAEAILLLAG
jgi:hypothetical protein